MPMEISLPSTFLWFSATSNFHLWHTQTATEKQYLYSQIMNHWQTWLLPSPDMLVSEMHKGGLCLMQLYSVLRIPSITSNNTSLRYDENGGERERFSLDLLKIIWCNPVLFACLKKGTEYACMFQQ